MHGVQCRAGARAGRETTFTVTPSRRVTTLATRPLASDGRAPTTANRRGITDKRHTRVGAAQCGAGTFPARDPRPAGVRGRRIAFARRWCIHERGERGLAEIRYRSETSPREARCLLARPARREFALLLVSYSRPCVQGTRPPPPLPRVHTPAIYYRVTRSWRGGRVVPFLTVCITHGARGCFRNFRWIGTFAKAPSREAGDGGERAWS